LFQAQKMEAVGQLTGGVAHDFNNLLTVIIGNLDAIAEQVTGDAKPLIETALKAAERGAALTHRLLAFSRRQTLSPETLDIDRLASDMGDLLRRTLGEHVEIEMKPHAGLWPAAADRGQVENALLNLAINARDAMPDGGTLTVATANVHLDADYAAHNSEVTPGDYVMLAVSDSGLGMSPETVERAIEPFFTTKEVGKGTGLGLSMIYGFAKQSRGHLKIDSKLNVGTTVRLYLPRANVEAAGSIAAIPPQAEHPRGGETILVVEDNPDVRGLIVRLLHGLGYRVVEAVDGRQAAKVLEGDAAIDLLFTDIIMPGGMTGKELANEARRTRPHLKILFMSGYAQNTIVPPGGLAPSDPFLPKPFRARELALKVRAVLDAQVGVVP
jgi:CheY-like chemotaxis protein